MILLSTELILIIYILLIDIHIFDYIHQMKGKSLIASAIGILSHSRRIQKSTTLLVILVWNCDLPFFQKADDFITYILAPQQEFRFEKQMNISFESHWCDIGLSLKWANCMTPLDILKWWMGPRVVGVSIGVSSFLVGCLVLIALHFA